MADLKKYIRTIHDFPKPGIEFRDVTSILEDAEGLKLAIDAMADAIKDVEFDVVAGAESRGFVFASVLAYKFNKPMLLVRKAGKLPGETVSETYDLEYGTATIEVNKDGIKPGQKVLLVDDLIATGGTLEAMDKLVNKLGGESVAIVVLMELCGFNARDSFKMPIYSVIQYEGK